MNELNRELIREGLSKIKYPENCPFCSKAGVNIMASEYQLIGFQRDGQAIKLGGELTYIPLAVIRCSNCGHISLFDLTAVQPAR